jgi:hypothetical protein
MHTVTVIELMSACETWVPTPRSGGVMTVGGDIPHRSGHRGLVGAIVRSWQRYNGRSLNVALAVAGGLDD